MFVFNPGKRSKQLGWRSRKEEHLELVQLPKSTIVERLILTQQR
jgi:hypothetical protein